MNDKPHFSFVHASMLFSFANASFAACTSEIASSTVILHECESCDVVVGGGKDVGGWWVVEDGSKQYLDGRMLEYDLLYVSPNFLSPEMRCDLIPIIRRSEFEST